MIRNSISTVLLLIGIVIMVNVLSNRFFFRLDLTEGNIYTLSQATRDILRELEQPLMITAYFSDDLPPDIGKTKRDFQDMLIEYANLSRGYIDYEFVNPESDEEKQEALQSGIRPVMINVRERDQVAQKQAFMGAVLEMGEQKEVIPFIQPGTAMEYALSTSIKKMAVIDKPSVGLLQGHGEPGLSQLAQAQQQLSILYSLENLDLEAEERIAERFRAVAIVAPADTIPPAHLAKLEDYLSRGGNLFIGLNSVDGDLNTAQGTDISTGLEEWLSAKGLQVEDAFLIDAQCGNVTVQQRQGFFTIATPVQFPFLPVITNFGDHPITRGLEQVILPFASPIRFTGDTSLHFTPIAFSSEQAGTVQTPTFFDLANKQWTAADFPQSNLVAGAVLEGPIAGTTSSRIVLVGDGDFAVSGQGQGGGQNPDDVSLLVNGIDWLSDDTGLIELRTKGVSSRPIDQAYMGEEAAGKRSLLKYLNFGLPILLVLLIGLIRYQQQRNIRLKRMQERYT